MRLHSNYHFCVVLGSEFGCRGCCFFFKWNNIHVKSRSELIGKVICLFCGYTFVAFWCFCIANCSAFLLRQKILIEIGRNCFTNMSPHRYVRPKKGSHCFALQNVALLHCHISMCFTMKIVSAKRITFANLNWKCCKSVRPFAPNQMLSSEETKILNCVFSFSFLFSSIYLI